VIVLDSSAAIDYLVELELGPWVAEQIRGEDVHAPHLIDIEVLGELRRRVQRRELDRFRAEEALEDLAMLDLTRHPHVLLLPHMWALRDNVIASDAVYVALASSLDAPLVTTDQRLARAPIDDVGIVAP
jgi:predicted nucleic acid-binding protein